MELGAWSMEHGAWSDMATKGRLGGQYLFISYIERMKDIRQTLVNFWKPALWLVVITVLCLIPPQDLPGKSLARIPHFDKVIHFGMYFILAVLLVRPLTLSGLKVWLWTLAISIFVGGVIEILQYAVTNMRSANWGDFGADVVGAVAGRAAYAWLVKGRRWERFS
jgi:VanZ family protein